MESGDNILDSLVAENLRCILCGKRPDNGSIRLGCDHKLCVRCLENCTKIWGEGNMLPCPCGSEEGSTFPVNGKNRLPSMNDDICKSCNDDQCDENGYKPVACNSCDVSDAVATSYCDECEGFMCEECTRAHTKLQRLMRTHQVVAITDLINGKARLKSKVRKCPSHKGEKLNFFCETCGVPTCQQCIVIAHTKPDHHCIELRDAEDNFKNNMANLIQRCDSRLEEVTSRVSRIETERRNVHLEFETLSQIINTTADDVIAEVNAQRQKLLSEVDVARRALVGKMERLHEANKMMEQRLESACHLGKIGGQSGLTLEHRGSRLFLDKVEDLLEENLDGDGGVEGVKEYARRMGFKRSFSSYEQISDIGELFQLSGWEISRQFDLCSPVLAMIDLPTGRVAIACEDEEGVDVFGTDGSKVHVLDDVKVKRMAALSDGQFVVIDSENSLRVFSGKGQEDTSIRFEHPEGLPEEALPVCVTTSDDSILVGYTNSAVCYIYPTTGGKATGAVSTGNVCPQQMAVTQSGNIIIMEGPDVVVIDHSGEVQWRLEENNASFVASAFYGDHIFVASIQPIEDTDDHQLSIDRYTMDGQLIETIVQDERVEGPNGSNIWMQMIIRSKATLAVSVGSKCLVFRGPQSLEDITKEETN